MTAPAPDIDPGTVAAPAMDPWAGGWPTAGIPVGRDPAGPRLGRRPVSSADDSRLLRWFVEAHPDLASVPLPDEARDRLLRQQLTARDRHHREAYPRAERWVFSLDGEPVGHVVIDVDRERVLLVELEVAADRRGRGIGTAVVAAAVARAGHHGLPARLTVGTTNPARRLYERAGFSPVNAPTDTRPVPDLLMEHP